MLKDFRQHLQLHKPVPLADEHAGRVRAAVLVPIIIDGENSRILLTQRAGSLSSHGGEVAFPGGKEDPDDVSLRATALRETIEEIGIEHSDVEIVGELRPFISKFGIAVTPFVGIVPADLGYQANAAEIASIFEVPVMFFATNQGIRVDELTRHGETHRILAFSFRGYEIWGLTSMIISEVLRVGLPSVTREIC